MLTAPVEERRLRSGAALAALPGSFRGAHGVFVRRKMVVDVSFCDVNTMKHAVFLYVNLYVKR